VTTAPCSWVLAEHDGASGFLNVPEIRKWAAGYAVSWGGERLSLSGSFGWPPQPSSRSDEWISEHTFASLEAAEAALRANTEWSREHAAEAAERARRARR
jgi:hypothetical protein